MKKINKYIKSIILLGFCTIFMTTSCMIDDKVIAASTAAPVKNQIVTTPACVTVNPLMIVGTPKNYVGKTVEMNARFDKFSTLGLDYKPAFKSSDDYISFLIKREDTTYDIPLSEMKLFIKRDEAEKFIDIKTDDKINIIGTVFSDALGDVWIDVKSLKITQKAPEKDGVKK